MELLKIVSWINISCGILFFVCYALQLFYIFLTCIKRPLSFPKTDRRYRYAVLISARNEEKVIGHLLDSIDGQTYPSELLDTYVVADNCTDRTAELCTRKGAVVYERFDTEHIGKGYALAFLLDHIQKEIGDSYYDGYIIIDADNILDPDYVVKMNEGFAAGNRIITSYRNSKNYGDNWISAGSSLWFLHESRQLNGARQLLGTSCAVSGTGFLVSSEIIREQGGWKHFLIIEDIEFTVDHILQGEKIAYCHDAILYDEQPVKFSQSWRQHVRWAKGYLQVLRHYGVRLVKGIFSGPRCLACYDMIMTICPAYFITVVGVTANLLSLIYIALSGQFVDFIFSFLKVFLEMYTLTYLAGIIAVVTEWRRIHCSAFRKLLLTVSFPLFMATYIPEAIAAFFGKATWKPIEHTVVKNISEVKRTEQKDLTNEKVS